MFDLTDFPLADMTRFGAELRGLGDGARSMEEVAQRTVRCVFERFLDRENGEPACALVRLYKTFPLGSLAPELQEFARKVPGSGPIHAQTRCLTLLATTGLQPEWQSRRLSQGHQAIPLTSAHAIEGIPMVAGLLKQLGLEVDALVSPRATSATHLEVRTYNVFYVAEAVGSPYLPAQQNFVVPYGIRSVIGFGGMVPPGDLFCVIVFSRVSVPATTVAMFKTLALNVKLALLPFVDGPVMAEGAR